MDAKRSLPLAAFLLFAATAPAWGGVAEDLANGEPIDTILMNATDNGVTVKDAVSELLGLRPDRAYDAIAAAICLIPNFKPSACTINGESLVYADCSDAVAAAAGQDGVSPGVIARASAAGRSCWINRANNPTSDEWGGGGVIQRTRRPVLPASSS